MPLNAWKNLHSCQNTRKTPPGTAPRAWAKKPAGPDDKEPAENKTAHRGLVSRCGRGDTMLTCRRGTAPRAWAISSKCRLLVSDRADRGRAACQNAQRGEPMEELIASWPRWPARYGAKRLVLFGSRARGDNRYNSDIDLAVYGMPEAAGRISGWTAKTCPPC